MVALRRSMAKDKDKFHYLADGSLDISHWLSEIKQQHQLENIDSLNQACHIAQKLAHGLTTFYGKSRIEHGLETAEILLELQLDQETAAASILSSTITLLPATQETIKQALGSTVLKLVAGVQQMELISTLQNPKTRNQLQIDKFRKLLLAMATDIRVVIIKLAERLSFMQGIKAIPEEERTKYAQEVLDIYAPLANRLGIGQLKWELEDLAFRNLDPVTYKTIATFLAERRIDREKRIQSLIAFLKEKLQAATIQAEVTGRAKHIYSIYSKVNRKDVSYNDIYDSTAVRILVPTIEDCYTALSLVNSLWPPIMKEFDDYIAHPKPNGYRSIHTAVIGDNGKHFEIQIRTHAMHEEAERGVAAHWMYKENKTNPVDDTAKITYLRQLLDWHKEISPEAPATQISSDHEVYVITPAGDIIDLPIGATPLDFAYHIHSEIGHRCRGAKINGHIVPLTYQLKTGDKVEIITVQKGEPSRDWLNAELGYVKTSRAKNKISHWFKQREFAQDVEEGRELLERELARHGLTKLAGTLVSFAKQFNLKDEDALLAALNRGNIRISQLIQAAQPKTVEKPTSPILTAEKKSSGSAIVGAADLLTRFAKCCKPIPGDAIIGYVTQGRGVSIHKKNCPNIKTSDPRRIMEINWDNSSNNIFSTDLKIIALDQKEILSDLTALFANEKIPLLSFNSTLNQNQNKVYILLTIQIQNITQLQHIVHRLKQLPNILEVSRIKR